MLLAGVVLAALAGCAADDDAARRTPQAAPRATPEPVTIAMPQRFTDADRLIGEAIAAGEMPGAVLLVGRDDAIVYRKAYGDRAVEPTVEPMTPDTLFDLASLTKPIATATSVMKLIDEGRLSVDDPVSKHIPEFAQNGKGGVTVGQLLLHRGGLTPDNNLRDYEQGVDEAWRRIFALSFNYPPGTRMRYSDVGYIVLGELVHRVDVRGRSLDVFAHDEVFAPLRMRDTMYNPPVALRPRIAPTAPTTDGPLRGGVHDPRSARLGGVAGHAGLFSTADDLSRYCRMLIHGGELDGVRVLSAETVALMTAHRAFPEGGGRTYGFDADTAYSSARGDRFDPLTTYGHTGFTGPMLWIDPVNRCYVILLCSRLHPDGKGNVLPLRRAVVTACAEALLGPGDSGDGLGGTDKR